MGSARVALIFPMAELSKPSELPECAQTTNASRSGSTYKQHVTKKAGHGGLSRASE